MSLSPKATPRPELEPSGVNRTQEGAGLEPPERFPAWSWWDVLAVFVFTLVSVYGFSLLTILAARTVPAYQHVTLMTLASNPKLAVVAQAAAYPVVALFIYVLVRSRAHRTFSEAIQWRWPSSALSFIAFGVGLALAIQWVSRLLPIPKSMPVDQYFNDMTSAYMMAMFGTTLAPLLEELFFRGLLFQILRRWLGLATAVVLTGAAFAAIHGAQLGYSWGPVVSIFTVGVALTLVRVRAGSVAASFLVHAGYNLTLFVLLWFASDHYRHLEKALS
jgi:membrane protease YdiL (CAAX protease family)